MNNRSQAAKPVPHICKKIKKPKPLTGRGLLNAVCRFSIKFVDLIPRCAGAIRTPVIYCRVFFCLFLEYPRLLTY